MKQNILRKLMLIAVLLTGSHAFAYDFFKDGIYYKILSEAIRTVMVTSYKGTYYEDEYNNYRGSVVIPEKLIYGGKTYTVTAIEKAAFYRSKNLTSVTIPNSVTSIGISAFSGCTGLTSVTIPNSVTSIGDGAFFGCYGLIGVNISDLDAWCNIDFGDFDSNPLYRAENLYLNKEKVTNLVIPNTITEIKKYAFYDCDGLTSVTIPNSVTSIGDYAFANCSGLTSVTIPNFVTSIGDSVFNNCFDLTEIYCKATNPPTCSTEDQPFSDRTLQYVTLYVPTGCKSAYESVDPWRNFWNIEEMDFSGVETTLVDDVNVSVENGNLIVNGADNAKVEVYSVIGQCVYSGNATTIPITAKGLYIVKVNNKSFKVIL